MKNKLTSLDAAKASFNAVRKDIESLGDRIATEADTRLHVIDRILMEVLGWRRENIKTEPWTGKGFIDYLINNGTSNVMVVEAKRISGALVDTKLPYSNYYLANGAALTSAKDGLEQAEAYSQRSGAVFSALTSGEQWIGYWCVGRGKPATDTKVIVFPSLETIDTDFGRFYDFFSREGVLSESYKAHFNEAEGLVISPVCRLTSSLSDYEIKLLPLSEITHDIQRVLADYFGALSSSADQEMLAHCFVETRESKRADHEIQKILETLISKITDIDSKGNALEQSLKDAVEYQRGEFVLVIGNKGAGKSTYMDRFFSLILDKDIRSKCAVVTVDLRDKSAELNNIESWLANKIIQGLEKECYRSEVPSYEELMSVFFKEYTRWMNAEFKYLYENDKNAFKIKFGEYIYSLRSTDPQLYVQRLMQHASALRQLMPCILFDNVDHFETNFQERVFQFAQAIYRGALSFVIVPITDKTIWQLSKQGPFQSYETISYYLPVPSIKSILTKRIEFIKQKLQLKKGEAAEYFSNHGIRIHIPDLNAFVSSIEQVLLETEYISRLINTLANYDIRRSLLLATKLMSSPWLNMEGLIKTYIQKHAMHIEEWRIRKALIVGNYQHYKAQNSEFVANLFTVNQKSLTTPLLGMSILRYFRDRDDAEMETGRKYGIVNDVYKYFDVMGIPRLALTEKLGELVKYRLLEPFDPTRNDVEPDQRLRISPSGRTHYYFAMRGPIYGEEMALTTPIRDESLAREIRHIADQIASGAHPRGREIGGREIEVKFREYCIEEDDEIVAVPEHEQYDGQRNLRYKFKRGINALMNGMGSGRNVASPLALKDR